MRLKKLFILVMATTFIFCGCGQAKDENKDVKTNNEANNVKKNENKDSTKTSLKIDINELKKQFDLPEKGDTIATINVKNFGSIKVKFFKDVAPKAVENFVTHAKNKYYDGLKFHRIINDFVIQGGDPKGDGTGGESIWNKPFEDEFPSITNPMPYPYNGALAMANAGPKTNGSQFFIVNAKYNEEVERQMKQGGYPEELLTMYREHGGTPHLFNKHTVFGQVFEGMDIVEKIMTTYEKTKEDVIIDNITISEY